MSTPSPEHNAEARSENLGVALWAPRPEPLRLIEGEVHLWRTRLERSESSAAPWAAFLSPDERGRAARFRFVEHRARFIMARGILRCILAGYLERSPSRIAFVYNPQGKPALCPGPGIPHLEFNASHSGDLALYAFVLGRPIGVDLEATTHEREFLDLARRFFTPAEAEALSRFKGETLARAFYACWTQKEAFVKAKGGGLSMPLDQFQVNVIPGEPAALLHADGDPEAPHCWTLHTVHVEDAYAAALAVEGRGMRFRHWSWESGPTP